MTVYNWTIERSGAALRIIGTDEKGEPVKLTRVVRVAKSDEAILATLDGKVGRIESAVLA